MELLFSIAVFGVFLVLWIGVAYGLAADQGGLDSVWKSIDALPLALKALVWLLFLPVTAGLWIWESAWPFVVRLPLLLGIAAVNLWAFFPKDLASR